MKHKGNQENRSDHAGTGRDQPDLLREIAELEEARAALLANVSQLEAFQLDFQREAMHLHNLAEYALDIGVYRLEAEPDNHYLAEILYISPAAREILGADDPMDQASWFRRLHPDDLEYALAAQAGALETGRLKITVRIFHKDLQQWRWLRFNALAASRQNPGKVVFNAFVYDVTDEYQARALLDERQEQLRALSYRQFQGEQTVRRRVSQYLRDQLERQIQSVEQAVRRARRDPAEREAHLGQALRVLDRAMDDTRQVTATLFPHSLGRVGIAETLAWLCRSVEKGSGIAVDFQAGDDPWMLDEEVSVLLYQSAFKLLDNAVRHSGADRLRVSLEMGGGGARLQVADNGRGMPSGPRADGSLGGLGLLSIREHLLSVGGDLEIRTTPGKGTSVLVKVPI